MAGYSLGCRLLQQESRKVPMCFCSFSESFIRSERPSFQRLIICCKPKRWNKLSVSFLNMKLLHFFGTRFGVGSDWSKSLMNNNYGWIWRLYLCNWWYSFNYLCIFTSTFSSWQSIWCLEDYNSLWYFCPNKLLKIILNSWSQIFDQLPWMPLENDICNII